MWPEGHSGLGPPVLPLPPHPCARPLRHRPLHMPEALGAAWSDGEKVCAGLYCCVARSKHSTVLNLGLLV